MAFDPNHPLGAGFKAAIQTSLDRFLDTQRDLLAEAGDRLDLVWQQARHFARSGKRMRPGFCYWGYVAAAPAGANVPAGVLDVAASLDLLHVSALVHDDLIDASDTRRGGPSAHRGFEAVHRAGDWPGDPASFGQAAAILLGDLMLAWSVSMVDQAAVNSDRLKRARPYLAAARAEVLAGQYLDLAHQFQPADQDWVEGARLAMEFKTAKYTVSRPVQVGAALAMADDATLQGLGRFGGHIGLAFQLRDDLLGVFGNPKVTGKPAGDDLREGKKTMLVAYALRDGRPKDVKRLTHLLGDPGLGEAELDEARQILTRSGAVDQTEHAIVAAASAGLKYLHRLDLSPEGTVALAGLVHAAVERVA